MSYEGYEMFICANGHLHRRDCYSESLKQCPTCDAPIVWWCAVNQTNDSGVAPVPVLYEAAKTCTCSCGHVHEIEPAQYCIPTNTGCIKQNVVLNVDTCVAAFETNGEVFSTKDEAYDYMR